MGVQRIRLWDLPTRVFHWALVALVTAAIITGKTGGSLIIWHGRIGLAILGLVVFRLIWGLVGSTYARFSQFLPTPATLIAYLKGEWQGVGHNPLGALSVCALLGTLAFLLGTGLVGNDDIAFRGPLFDLVGKEGSDRLIGWHRQGTNLLFVLIGAHLAAILFYIHIKKDALVRPMLNGWKEVPPGTAESARGGSPTAFIAALLIAMAAAWGASGAWLPPPPPPPATQTAPAW